MITNEIKFQPRLVITQVQEGAEGSRRERANPRGRASAGSQGHFFYASILAFFVFEQIDQLAVAGNR